VIAPGRIAAYETILAVSAGRADLPAALARARTSLTDERDRALAGEIATGTLRWQAAFDYLIEQFARRSPARLDPEILTILRISIFQLLHLDRVPASAVVNDAVELAGKVGKRSASGLVNALLRRVSRERASLPLPMDPPLEHLSITLSHPRWLAARWLKRYGIDRATAWATFDNSPAPLTLRTNTLKITRDGLGRALRDAGVETELTRVATQGLVVTKGNPLLTPLAQTGVFVVQDEASQLVGEYVGAASGEKILDACASPGGKTTQMAAAMDDHGTIVAADVRGRRLELLVRTVAASGARRIRVVQANARGVPPFADAFDAVLVDAPCSGLGTIRRDPDVRWRRSEMELTSFAEAQREMLDQLATVVRLGGRLIYSTCSSEPEENEQIVEAFVAQHPEFRLATPSAFSGDPRLLPLLDDSGALRTLPFRDSLEAFYAAMLTRTR
jgi:16S rRNA (cytosine967-C5)-methyltransferase